MSGPSLEFWAIVQRLLRDLEPEDCESQQEYEWALELHALPLGIDLWSRVFLTPDGEVIWVGWEPIEIKRSRDEADFNAALRMAAEKYPAMTSMLSADLRHLQAAQGWLKQGNHLKANEELENITPKFRAHPAVLELRWQVYAKAKDWIACVDIGKTLTMLAPESAVSWIHHAFALHELKRTQEAFDVLSPVAVKFPAGPTIPYNLACYTCQLGDLVAARDWFAQAMRLGNEKEIKLQAIDDPDLAPLWTGEF